MSNSLKLAAATKLSR